MQGLATPQFCGALPAGHVSGTFAEVRIGRHEQSHAFNQIVHSASVVHGPAAGARAGAVDVDVAIGADDVGVGVGVGAFLEHAARSALARMKWATRVIVRA